MIGAIDIGGTKIAAGVVNAEGRIFGRRECPTAPERGFADALQRMTGLLRTAAQSAGGAIDGIGVGCTGPVDAARGVIGDVAFLPGWEGAPLTDALAAEFGVKAAMENDADAAALAEAEYGAGRGSSRFIYITISTGIGGGIILDGRLYRGVGGSHPEPGHHVIDPAGPLCFCGAYGCWETLASGPAMAAWAEMNAVPGDLPLRHPKLPTAEEICRLAEAGNETARRAVEREARYLGLGLANLITIFCPDVIALGGGLMKSAHLFLAGAREVIGRNCGLVPADKVRLTTAALGADAALAGAACVWRHRFSGEINN